MASLQVQTLVTGPLEENAYLLCREGMENAILIDPGDDYEALMAALRASGKRLSDILLTHGHFDHMLSACRIQQETGCRVHIHPSDAPFLSDASLNLADPRMMRGKFEPMQADALFTVLEEADVLISGYAIHLLYCPGHTPGGMSFYFQDSDAVFTGDTLFANGFGRTDFPGGSITQLRRSLKRLLKLPEQTVAYPGHGPSSTIGAISGGWL